MGINFRLLFFSQRMGEEKGRKHKAHERAHSINATFWTPYPAMYIDYLFGHKNAIQNFLSFRDEE